MRIFQLSTNFNNLLLFPSLIRSSHLLQAPHRLNGRHSALRRNIFKHAHTCSQMHAQTDKYILRFFFNCRDSWNEPKKVEGLSQVTVQAAFASGVISTAIGNDGSLWVWGKSKRGQLGLGKEVTEALTPSRVESLADEKIVKVAFGWGHALARTEDGKLYGWGYAADGRLGQIGRAWETSLLEEKPDCSEIAPGVLSTTLEAAEKLVLEGMEKEKHMPVIWEPILIEEMHEVEVVDVACGLDHSLVLCRNGTLLSSGSNVYGQLGREESNLEMLPVNIGSIRPASMAAGLGHSLAVAAEGIVSWGWNRSCQLGRPGLDGLPLVVEALAGETPTSVTGGRVHTMALTSKGEVWVWGCGRNGRLGLGSSLDETEPHLLEYLEGCHVRQVVSGFDHSLVLLSE